MEYAAITGDRTVNCGPLQHPIAISMCVCLALCHKTCFTIYDTTKDKKRKYQAVKCAHPISRMDHRKTFFISD